MKFESTGQEIDSEVVSGYFSIFESIDSRQLCVFRPSVSFQFEQMFHF